MCVAVGYLCRDGIAVCTIFQATPGCSKHERTAVHFGFAAVRKRGHARRIGGLHSAPGPVNSRLGVLPAASYQTSPTLFSNGSKFCTAP
jgi:hypothetical protein